MKHRHMAGAVFIALATIRLVISMAHAQSVHGQYNRYPVARLVVDGQELKPDVPAIIIDGRTLVPARAIAEALGADVQWDPATYTVHITSRRAAITAKTTLGFQQASVTRIIDGDTVEVMTSGVRERLRLIGLDCPELGTDQGAITAEYTKKVLDGKTVYLETDIGLRDKYGRLLAYVWLSKPEQVTEETIRSQMFNARLLLDGMAQLMTVPPNVKYVEYFTVFQREAREAKTGLWR